MFVLGWVFLGIGFIGLLLPLLPGTVFLILSAACFARSSPRFEAWLLDHPRLGPPVRRWRETGAVPRPAKVLACVSLGLSWVLMAATSAPWLAKGLTFAILCAVAGYVVSRPDS